MISTLLAKHWYVMGMFPLLAVDAVVPSARPWGTLSATGLLIFYVWYDLCKKQPRQEAAQDKQSATHAKMLEDHTDRYEGIIEKQNEAHRQERDAMKEERDAMKASIDKLCDTVRSEK